MSRSYFSHDSNARNDDKILNVRMKYGMEGYGIYFGLIERLREEQDYTSKRDFNAIGFDFHVDASKIKDIVESFGLFSFTDDGECFYSESLNDRMAHMDDRSAKRSEAGKKGAAKRWGGKQIAKPSKPDSNAIAMPSETDSNKTKLNKTKPNKTKSSQSHAAAADDPVESLRFFQENLGVMPPIMQQQVADWAGDLGNELVIEAITRAVAAEKGWPYAQGILRNWDKKNIRTIEQVKAEDVAHDRKNAARGGYGKPSRQETLPKWAEPDYKTEDKPVDTNAEARIADKLAKLQAMQGGEP